MSDSDRPLGSTGIKAVSKELEFLTNEEGPLYKLVAEVRYSNKLARSNQVRLAITLVGLLLCVLLLAVALWLVSGTVDDLVVLQKKQVEALEYAETLVEFAEETDKKVEQAQATLEEAPKVIADKETGELVVVATVQVEAPDASVSAAEAEEATKKKRRRSKRRAAVMKKVDDALASMPEPPPAPAPAPEPMAKKAKRSIQIPIRMDKAELK